LKFQSPFQKKKDILSRIRSGGLRGQSVPASRKHIESEIIRVTLLANLQMLMMENSETQAWLHFSLACRYFDQIKHDELFERSEEVGKLLNHMIENPERYLRQKRKLEGVE